MDTTPDRLTDALRQMSTEHLACRDYGHNWTPFRAEWKPAERAYFTQLRCARCATIRERWLDRTGAQLSNHYTYADGYLVKGLGRLTGVDRDAVRLASIMALLPTKAAKLKAVDGEATA